MKLDKSKLPAGHSFSDFTGTGPVATLDGQFDGTRLADFGCFKQGLVDSNKFYLAAIVTSKINSKPYVYFEWGRTGASNKDFQLIECDNELEAEKVYVKQCHAKNDKRGVWGTVAGIKTLQAKPNKDVYLVRQLVGRSSLLPDLNGITNSQAVAATKPTSPNKSNFDPESTKLLADLTGGTVAYARASMANNTIPSQDAITMGRTLLLEAQKHLSSAPNKDLEEITTELYSRIPKKKARKAEWILNSNNILEWQNDLDAYESALGSQSFEVTTSEFGDLPFELRYISKDEVFGQFMYKWWVDATLKKHYYGNMKILGMWEIKTNDQDFLKSRSTIQANNSTEKPYFQEKIIKSEADKKSNLHWLFHGTRSCNLLSILKSGLRMPNTLSGVHITGAMFGGGIYWADDWMKSAGYTSLGNSYWSRGSGTIANRKAFMFTGEVILGNVYVSPRTYSQNTPPSGYHSVMGKGGYSGVQNNEFVVYKTPQCKLRYLIEFETSGS